MYASSIIEFTETAFPRMLDGQELLINGVVATRFSADNIIIPIHQRNNREQTRNGQQVQPNAPLPD